MSLTFENCRPVIGKMSPNMPSAFSGLDSGSASWAAMPRKWYLVLLCLSIKWPQFHFVPFLTKLILIIGFRWYLPGFFKLFFSLMYKYFMKVPFWDGMNIFSYQTFIRLFLISIDIYCFNYYCNVAKWWSPSTSISQHSLLLIYLSIDLFILVWAHGYYFIQWYNFMDIYSEAQIIPVFLSFDEASVSFPLSILYILGQ